MIIVINVNEINAILIFYNKIKKQFVFISGLLLSKIELKQYFNYNKRHISLTSKNTTLNMNARKRKDKIR